ncbi:CehA/McbA family metallohydrolase [Tessaracoccus sp. HDW20]|uniref:CehA/McbA family metallohydrolase n=1 Tax=Tessaracoccus coleopterorum TaxID=2714950 RepID=UPI0018D4AA90|nr:CehA/McbA family metallohydrolase [Tessaracoccus coleopterorum]NHB85183.1 CehA/McbA family metallohydrolase [Tessaracoccus coleopterorum]
MRWYAGDTHSHSLHSDGALSLWELANEGVASGLDFLCVTDHCTTSHHAHLPSVGDRHGITLVPGQEITTHAGHSNAYGEIGFIDFRRPAQEWVDTVAERGGFMSINHPVSGDCSWLHLLEREPGGVELYHSSWYEEPIATSCLAWFQRWRRDVVLIGGGDFHNRSKPLRPGLPTTWVAAEELSPDAILDAIRAGRTAMTGSGTFLSDAEARPVHDTAPILLREGDELLALAAKGLVLISGSGRRLVVDSDAQRIVAARARARTGWRTRTARCSPSRPDPWTAAGWRGHKPTTRPHLPSDTGLLCRVAFLLGHGLPVRHP